MLGVIIGDIVGSRFEFNAYKSTEFEFLTDKCFVTDDTIMSLAVGLAIIKSNMDLSVLPQETVELMQKLGRQYPNYGYGGMFAVWLENLNPKPYNSLGNGSAMRVSACGFMGNSLREVKDLSNAVSAVTHNHPEGLKGAEAVAVAIYLARIGKSKQEIREYITQNYYSLDFTLDQIRPTYDFDETCPGSVPQALQAFFESSSFEDCIRLAVSLGGDADTQAAIAGGIAQAYYGIPLKIKEQAYTFLDDNLKNILNTCETHIKNYAKILGNTFKND